MRRNLTTLAAVILCCAVLAAGQASQKVINFKKLQEFLPKIELSGFTKGKPEGQTSSMMGMSTSEASLRYEKGSGDHTISLEVKIEDTAGIPFAQLGGLIGVTEFENQTENGYEKSVKIQGFAGTEKVENAEDSKSAEINLFAGNRFMLTLRAEGTSEVALLRKLLDSMNLGELAKVTQ